MPKTRLTAAERRLRAQQAAYTSWANTDDPAARLQPARTAFRDTFYDKVDPGRLLPVEERERKAEAAYKAHMAGLALKSSKARRLRRDRGVPTNAATVPSAETMEAAG